MDEGQVAVSDMMAMTGEWQELRRNDLRVHSRTSAEALGARR